MRSIFTILLAVLLLTSSGYASPSVQVESDTNVIAQSRENCVRVLIAGKPAGSGFFIHELHVVTCCHVVTAKAAIDPKQNKVDWEPHGEIAIQCSDGEKIDAVCVSVPTSKDISPLVHDFAVLKLKKKPKSSTTLLSFFRWSNTPPIGSEVLFSGYPLGTPAMLTHKGIVSGIAANQNVVCIQAPINKGNSGSALLNSQGEIMGVISIREGEISQGLQEL